MNSLYRARLFKSMPIHSDLGLGIIRRNSDGPLRRWRCTFRLRAKKTQEVRRAPPFRLLYTLDKCGVWSKRVCGTRLMHMCEASAYVGQDSCICVMRLMDMSSCTILSALECVCEFVSLSVWHASFWCVYATQGVCHTHTHTLLMCVCHTRSMPHKPPFGLCHTSWTCVTCIIYVCVHLCV